MISPSEGEIQSYLFHDVEEQRSAFEKIEGSLPREYD